MTRDSQPPVHTLPQGYHLAPLRPAPHAGPLQLCLIVRSEPDPALGPFVLLREVPGARVFLGAACDAAARIHEWIEISVQSLEVRDLKFSGFQERVTNAAFDQRWLRDVERTRTELPGLVMVTGMETEHPAPLLLKQAQKTNSSPWIETESSTWRLCRDEALLQSLGMPGYATSPFRYLHDPGAAGKPALVATTADAPTNEHVRPSGHLASAPGVNAVFNPHAGLLRATRATPLGMEEYLQILEGSPWTPNGSGLAPVSGNSVYAGLQTWSHAPKSLPFLLHPPQSAAERVNEILLLKLSLLRDLFREVRSCVKAQQLPLLNLAPSSFRVHLQQAGGAFPILWSSRAVRVKPGQSHPLEIKSTDQKYFIRLGEAEPSPFLPAGLAAHSFGVGSVRVRAVESVAAGVTLEGTLEAEDYLKLDAQDLLWFKLPLADQKLEFYAHVDIREKLGPREARFRTVPARLAENVVVALKNSTGSPLPRAPYEVWPLVSSPCDLHSLGILAIRILLANHQSRLAVTVDEVISLARVLGSDDAAADHPVERLKSLLESDPRLNDLVSPHLLAGPGLSPEQARSMVSSDVWTELVTLVLRLFPGTGAHAFCRSLGDVSPLALETVFDRPLQEIETLLLRQRSLLLPGQGANAEIAAVLAQCLEGS
jgi:hypothetical protein